MTRKSLDDASDKFQRSVSMDIVNEYFTTLAGSAFAQTIRVQVAPFTNSDAHEPSICVVPSSLAQDSPLVLAIRCILSLHIFVVWAVA